MIAKKLLTTGILQFGLFTEDIQQSPYRIRLEMLSAYPEVMQQIIYRGVQTIATVAPFDRLISHSTCIPLASALSLNTGISLVYSRGTTLPAVHDLVGAYDVGHPSCLIVNTITPEIEIFLDKCHRVGLNIHTVVEVVSTGETLSGVDQHAIFTLRALIHELKQAKAIPTHLAQVITQSS